MIGRCALAIAIWACTPLVAENLDDATCGVIGEYAMDLAYDAGMPVELAPDGTAGADDQGCYMTGLIVSPDGPSGLRIGYLGWSGAGLEDWVAGHGLPVALNITMKGAHLQTRIPDHPAFEWSSNVINRRNLLSGVLNARWDPLAGRLAIDRFEMRNLRNAIVLSGVLGGIPAEPSQVDVQALALHAMDVRIDMAGAFEALFLTPLAAGLLIDQDDPEAAFAGFVDLARSYLNALPDPQVDAATQSALNRFLTSLPSPTGRLSVTLDAPKGVSPSGSLLLMTILGNATPEHVGRAIGSILGTATLRAQWQATAVQ